ncbi:NAD(P)-dependent oxidoreductase [Novosphingobium flavum]|uniref:NAD(P)-dependent oxidoreductase n=1 Tax=Novosphingobium flavum TaxID=1778672 RepID=A0A7X1FNF3_9SPHN|nr:NAD(P)-dependent oxidoreductase [Novosphingobium flavum]MBC2663996.1 NAD(P)-dependent oxidoreductase [Novosphingobium flavum]
MTLVAITGATGFVGQALIERALGDGIEVRALTRADQPARKGVTWVKGDLANIRALARLMKGAEAVIHVAGVINAPDPAGFEAGNVTGTLTVIEAARKAGVPRFVFVSSLSAREPDLSAYGASKAKAEKLVKSSGLDWTIVRPPAIYGPRDKEILELFRIARWGVLPMPPKAGRASLLHVDDLARLLLALVPPSRNTGHKVFEPDDGRPGGWSHYELARAIGWAVGRRPLVLHLSQRLLDGVAWADARLRGDRAKLTPDRVGYMCHPDWVVRERARPPQRLWQARIETRQGLETTARWYCDEGWL